MPTFELTSPDGQTYEVDGPDGATPVQAFGVLQGHLKTAAASAPAAQAVPVDHGPADDTDPLTRVTPSTPSTGASGAVITPAPQGAGGGRGFVNPPAAAPSPRDVGFVESAGRGWGRSGATAAQTVFLLGGAGNVVYDKLRSMASGKLETGAQDALFKNWVDPTQEAIDWYALKPDDRSTFLGKVGDAVGGMVQDLPLMIASGGAAQRAKLAQEFPTIGRYLENAFSQGFDAMRPIMVKAGTEKAKQVLEAGGSVPEAVNSATTAAMLTGFQGGQPMSATGNLAQRVATGVPVGMAQAEAGRVIQNAADPDNLQRPFDPAEMAAGGVTNAIAAGAMGHGAPGRPADRIDLGYDPLTGKTPVAEAVQGMGEPLPRPGPGRAAPARDHVADILNADSVEEATQSALKLAERPAVGDIAAELRAIRPTRPVDLAEGYPDERADAEVPADAAGAAGPGSADADGGLGVRDRGDLVPGTAVEPAGIQGEAEARPAPVGDRGGDVAVAPEREEASRRADEESRARADADLPDFTLTGSDRAADANPDQGGLFAGEPAAARGISAATRSKPRGTITFEKPVTGPSGAKLTGYTWQWKPVGIVDATGEDRTIRVSDWEKSEANAETGRDVVHQFIVDRKVVSLESAAKLLGYDTAAGSPVKTTAAAVKTLARRRMQLSEVEESLKAFGDDRKTVDAMPLPEITGPDEAKWFHMGDATVRQPFDQGPITAERERVLAESWRDNRLAELGWKGGQGAGDSLERQAYDLQDQIKRAEKKIGATVKVDAADTAAKRGYDPAEGPPLTTPQVKEAVARITSRWENGPRVQVVLSPRDLPGTNAMDTRGLYTRDHGLFVVASLNRSPSAVAETLAHEAVAHYGLRDMLGRERWLVLMDQIQGAADRGDKVILELRDEVRRIYRDERGENYLKPRAEADEITALAVERAIGPDGQFRPGFEWVKAVYARVAEFLRAHGFAAPEFTNAELQGMLVQAQRHLEAGQRTAGRGDLVLAAARESGEPADTAEARTDKPLEMPDAAIGGRLGGATSHPDYKAAKAGDVEAGVRVAQDLVTDELAAKVKANLGGKKPLVLPVVSEEAAGRNTIPRAAAELLAYRLGLETAGDIVQANRAHRTGMDGLERIFRQVDFHGEVQPRDYLLLDDTLTQGGTLAALASHIEEGGGRVVGVVALTGKQYSAKIRPEPETLKVLRQKHGDLEDQFRTATGHGFDALTQSEARYLANFEPAQRLRDRIAEGARRAGEREDQGNAPGREALDDFEGDAQARSADLDKERSREGATSATDGMPATAPGGKWERSKSVVSDLIDEGLSRTGVYRFTAPMSEGSVRARAVAQNFANAERLARAEWQGVADKLERSFTPEQRQKMWEAADEQNTVLQKGESTAGRGLERLTPAERDAVEQLHTYGEELLRRAKNAGMFQGEGLPYWTPRMMVMLDEHGEYARPAPEPGKKQTSGGDGRNVFTTPSNLKQRKYLTAEETEAAMKAKGGELVKDIMTMPMAMQRLEKAIAGRELINQIKELGRATGEPTVQNGRPGDGWFTLDHSAFTTFQPRFERDAATGKLRPLLDEKGEMVFDRVPLYMSKEFEGPIKAILSNQDGAFYRGLMLLKSKAMSAIMFSPLIHNLVIFGRALGYDPTMAGTVALYFKGHAARQDNELLRTAIDGGMVPMGYHRNGMLDITDVARGFGKEGGFFDPHESWIAHGAKAIVGTVNKNAGAAAKRFVDKAGDFWHGTLLWDRVADLQMGIFAHAYDRLLEKGFEPGAAKVLAAHWANRYAGAVGRENMGEYARKAANVLLFSRSFNMGNLGTVKDLVYGMPSGLRAKIEAEYGRAGASKVFTEARRKAWSGFTADAAMSLIALSLAQSAVDRLKKDKGWDEIFGGYTDRASRMWENVKAHPANPKSYSPWQLSPTHDNEPGKADRVDMGQLPDASGRHEYMRLPTGKVVEDLFNWTTHLPTTFESKTSPLAKAVWTALTNDKGFGVPVYDPNGRVDQGAVDVAKHLAKAQVPWDTIVTAWDRLNGKASQVEKDKLAGNMTGFTFSQGHPQGPAAGVAAEVEDRIHAQRMMAMEEVKRLLKYDKEGQAREKLEAIGLSPREITQILRRIDNPKDGMTRGQQKRFNQHGTEEDQQRMDRVTQ